MSIERIYIHTESDNRQYMNFWIVDMDTNKCIEFPSFFIYPDCNVQLAAFLGMSKALLIARDKKLKDVTIYTEHPEVVEWINEKKCGKLPKLDDYTKDLLDKISKTELFLEKYNFNNVKLEVY